MDLLNPTDDEKQFVQSRAGVHIPSIEALSEIESSSRLVVNRGIIYGSTPVVAQADGMNFKLMPELEWLWGYPFGLTLIAISALIPFAWFKWRGWF
jgi:Mg2+ and Co2+ transporter CorA